MPEYGNSVGRYDAEDSSAGYGPEPGSMMPEIGTDSSISVIYEPPPLSPAMQKIMKNDELHDRMKDYFKERILFSEDAMSRFYARWSANEMRIQAFVYHPKNEAYLKSLNDAGELPNSVRIVIPFGYAALHTIASHMLYSFTANDPVFQVGSYKDESIGAAEHMQTLLDFQADATGLVGSLWQFFQDINLYGFGALQNDWEVRQKMRTIRSRQGIGTTSQFAPQGELTHERRLVTVYEGNRATPIDPFLFFPDPRVPMFECNTAGEFCFWRSYESWFTLKELELVGAFAGIDKATKKLPHNEGDSTSSRAKLARGISIPGSEEGEGRHGMRIYKGEEFRQVDQGTCKLIPKHLGLGDSEVPELWVMAMINKDRIVQLEQYDTDHGMHPIVVAEPNGMGYSFGSPGGADYVAPIQDQLSFLFNSHSENIRSFLNNALVVDPSKIVMKDLRQRRGGQIIRLKQSAIGSDVRTAIHQLDLTDVTRANIADAQILMQLGHMLLAVNESTMGSPQPADRETATGARINAAAGTSRLGTMSKIISVQAFRPLAEQWTDNTQQYMTDEFYAKIVGERGLDPKDSPFSEENSSAYTFPVHDGTMPLDPVALSSVWKSILEAGAAIEGFGEQYDAMGIFEKAASMAGAKEIKSFRKQKPGQAPQAGPRPEVPGAQGVGTDGDQLQQLVQSLGSISEGRQ